MLRAGSGWVGFGVAAWALAVVGCSEAVSPPAHLSWVDPRPLVSEPGRHAVEVVASRQVVPSAGLAASITLGASNNNVDVVRFAGRTYMGFRTAPNHFASAETRMVVVSSDDEQTWREEVVLALGTDVREPRFLSFGGRLRFFYSLLGKDPLSFQPQGVRYIELGESGWSEPKTYTNDDVVVWRTRERGGVAFMSSYDGGVHEYSFDGVPMNVFFLQSSDGTNWRPVGPSPIVYTGGAGEMDFAWDDAGDLWFVMRVEGFDPSGLGSKICVSRGGDLRTLFCRSDPKKYDSPLLFAHDGEIYLVGRRNLTETGYFGDPTKAPGTLKLRDVVYAQLDYRNAPKRCALWRLQRSEMRVAYMMDLPSNGDTCFASVLPGATAGEFVLYDYSTDPSVGDRTWIQGQEGPTQIYRHTLRFRPR